MELLLKKFHLFSIFYLILKLPISIKNANFLITSFFEKKTSDSTSKFEPNRLVD